MARTKTYKDCKAINGVLGTPNPSFQPFRGVLWQRHCFENILKYKCLNWGGKIHGSSIPGRYGRKLLEGQLSVTDWISTSGHFLKDRVWLFGDGKCGDLESAGPDSRPTSSSNQQKTLSSRLLWNLGFDFYLRELGLIPLSSLFQVVRDQSWDLHTLLHLQHRSPGNGLSVSILCYLSSWVICSQVLV